MDDSLALHPMQRPYPLFSLLEGSALLRQDIAGDCPGVPLTLQLRLVSAGRAARPLPHAAVCLWHCDRAGLLHDERSAEPDRLGRPTRLRGVQVSDAAGRVAFRTIFPGAHTDGRALLHLQIYLSDSVHVTGIAQAGIVLPQPETLRVHVRSDYRPGPVGLVAQRPSGPAAPGPMLDGIALDGNPSAGYVGRLTVSIRPPNLD